MFPVHRNETGMFQELAHVSNMAFGQLSVLGVNPGCTRGGHYHIRKQEWFCAVSGTGILKIMDLETREEKIFSLDGFKERQFFLVNPNEVHWVINTDPYTDLEVLIIISEEYDKRNADTFKFEE